MSAKTSPQSIRDADMQQACDRLASLAELHTAAMEKYMPPFLLAVGVAGIVACYLVWAMYHSVALKTDWVSVMQSPMAAMSESVTRIGEEMVRIGDATVTMTARVEEMTAAMQGSAAVTARNLPHLVWTTEAMTRSMGRFGGDVGQMATPMWMIGGMMPW